MIRYSARAAIISLIIAVATLALSNVVPPSFATTGLIKLVFWSASTISVIAMLAWVLLSGIRAMFTRGSEGHIESQGDLW